MPDPPEGWEWVVVAWRTTRPSVHLKYKTDPDGVPPQIMDAAGHSVADIVAAANRLLADFVDGAKKKQERKDYKAALAEELGCKVY